MQRKWYPDLTEYKPDGVKGQKSLSSTAMLLSGIDLIKEMSREWKRSCSKGMFQDTGSWLIRLDTVISSKPLAGGEVTYERNSEGSQGSDHTLIFAPEPTLHLMPSLSTSLPTKILLHAYEPEWHSVASMMGQFGEGVGVSSAAKD